MYYREQSNQALLPTLDERAVSRPERLVQRGRAYRSTLSGMSRWLQQADAGGRWFDIEATVDSPVCVWEELVRCRRIQHLRAHSTSNQAVEATSTQRTVSRLRTTDCQVAMGGRASPCR